MCDARGTGRPTENPRRKSFGKPLVLGVDGATPHYVRSARRPACAVTPCTLWVQLSLPFTPRAERIPAAIDRTTGAYAGRYVRPLGHGAPLPASGLRRANGE